MSAILTADGLVGGYGDADVLNGVSLAVESTDIAVIVGPNGAGKSTALKALFGLVKLREGRVTLLGEDITGAAPDAIVPRGMGYVPQERNIFPNLTVHENLEMGAYIRRGDISTAYDRVYSLFPPLAERRRSPAGTLSGGQRQMVAIGRALMLEPRILLLDEPTVGLSPLFIEQIFDRIVEINRAGIAVLMVEQNARYALRLASRGYVLAGGRNRFSGTGPTLLADPEVARSFLGGQA
ncbi:MAG TPA: ABC transporter ATP-binding protein [Alphaproteobacteria bacterium]|nr:ABC transporter ATP-binding protein [Alphaproteobacteria bacterium]